MLGLLLTLLLLPLLDPGVPVGPHAFGMPLATIASDAPLPGGAERWILYIHALVLPVLFIWIHAQRVSSFMEGRVSHTLIRIRSAWLAANIVFLAALNGLALLMDRRAVRVPSEVHNA